MIVVFSRNTPKVNWYGARTWSGYMSKEMLSNSAFGFCLPVLIRGGWRVDLSRGRLREKSAKISRTSSSWPTASAWDDTAKETPSTLTTTSGKEDDIVHRVFDLPIPSRKAL